MTQVYRTLRVAPSDEFDAEQAERYGWVNRALPDADLDAFVARLAWRIASFPAGAVRSAKRVLNDLTLPGGSASWSPRIRPRAARPPCSRRACRPAARPNSTSATA